MPKRYWGIVFAFVGLGAIGGGIVYGLIEQAGYAERAKGQFARYSESAADQEADTCKAIAASQFGNCKTKQASKSELAAHDKQREYDDLLAQQKSALWAMVMGIAALFGMALSLIGVILVWVTFQETRRTNRIAAKDYGRARLEARRTLKIAEDGLLEARQVNKAQLRPYVAFTISEEKDDKPFSRSTKLYVVIKNFGQLPASNVRILLGEQLAVEPFRDLVVPVDENFGDYGLLPPHDLRKESIDCESITDAQLAEIYEGGKKLLVRMRLEYTWPGGADHHDVTSCLDDPHTNKWNLVDDCRREKGDFN